MSTKQEPKTSEPVKGFRNRKQLNKVELNSAVTRLTQQVSFQQGTLLKLMRENYALQRDLDALAIVLGKEESGEGSEKGDTVLINYFGRLYKEDGTLGDPFPGGIGFNHAISYLNPEGSSYIPGFELALFDKAAGDEFEVNLEFPKEYPQEKSLAGKKVQFVVEILKVYKPLSSGLVEGLKDEYEKAQKEKREAAKAKSQATKAEAKVEAK